MSSGIRLRPSDGPLDVDALVAFVESLPGARRDPSRDEGARRVWWLDDDVRTATSSHSPPLLMVGAEQVSLWLKWTDNRYGHGGRVLRWVLDRHTCTGQDLDYGTHLHEQAACRALVDQLTPETPHTTENANALLGQLLCGRFLAEVRIDFCYRITLLFRDLHARDIWLLLDEDRLGKAPAGLLAAYEHVGSQLTSASCAADNTLLLGFGQTGLQVSGALLPDADMWVLRDDQDQMLLEPAPELHSPM